MPPIAAIAHTAPNRSEMISADGLYHVAYKSSIADARHGSFGPGRMSRIVENVRVPLRPPGLQVPAAVEYRGGTQALAFQTIEEKIRQNTRAILQASRNRKVSPRKMAVELARERVLSAMSYCRF